MNKLTPNASDVVVQARGEVDETERAYARDKVDRLRSLAPQPVLFARVDLTKHADPAQERPAFAKAELDVNGRLVRAHVAAATMFEGIDLLEDRLRERLERFAYHEEAKHLRFRGGGDHEWRHGDEISSRPSYFPRPVAETAAEIRHSATRPSTLNTEDAIELLDLGSAPFVFFVDTDDQRGRVLYRRYDGHYGHYGLIEPDEEA